MRKSATVPISRWSEPAPVSLAKVVQLVLHMCFSRSPRSSPTEVQHQDGGAGPSRHLHGRPGSRSRPDRHRRHDGGAAPVREIDDTACTPSGAACVLSRGTQHCSRMKLQTSCYWCVARSTEWTVPHTLETSCAEASKGSYGVPRGVTR